MYLLCLVRRIRIPFFPSFIAFSFLSEKYLCYFESFPHMKFLGSATITGKNQITIPRRVIEEMDLEVGEALIFLQDKEGHVFLTTEVALPE